MKGPPNRKIGKPRSKPAKKGRPGSIKVREPPKPVTRPPRTGTAERASAAPAPSDAPAAAPVAADVRVLFRYRDLVADTLAEHKKIILEQGKCWWGWWKRPQESSRTDIWDLLDAEIATKGFASVGLFHSGTGTAQLASIDAIRRPVPSGAGDYPLVHLTEEEKALVPPYYRDSPFSRAWLRITKIVDGFSLFRAHSIAVPPPMPLYSAAELDVLRGKVILDADELRSMDTTIWQIRPKEQGDREERVLTVKMVASAAVTRAPISVRGNAILHLTDLHFASGNHRTQHVWRLESETSGTPSLAEAIERALKPEHRSQIGAIVVTGDVTFVGSSEEFKEATHSLLKLAGNLGVGVEHIFVVPGNHDIKWTRNDTYDDRSPVANAPPIATENYRQFYRQLLQHDPHAHLCMGRRFILPNGIIIDICGLNSSSLEQGRDFLAGMGRIQETAFQTAINEMGWSGSPGQALRLLAIHHHLVPTEDLDDPGEYSKGFGMAIDAARIQRLAAQSGVHLVLHGHRHRLFVWRSGVYELPEDNQTKWYRGELSIIGGGSAGSRSTDGERNFFNVFEFQSDRVRLTPYRSRRVSVFTPNPAWEAPLSIVEGRLQLGEWSPATADTVAGRVL